MDDTTEAEPFLNKLRTSIAQVGLRPSQAQPHGETISCERSEGAKMLSEDDISLGERKETTQSKKSTPCTATSSSGGSDAIPPLIPMQAKEDVIPSLNRASVHNRPSHNRRSLLNPTEAQMIAKEIGSLASRKSLNDGEDLSKAANSLVEQLTAMVRSRISAGLAPLPPPPPPPPPLPPTDYPQLSPSETFKPLKNWSAADVEAWLDGIPHFNRKEVQTIIREHGITGPVLLSLREAEWKDIGLTAFGLRKQLLLSCKLLMEQLTQSTGLTNIELVTTSTSNEGSSKAACECYSPKIDKATELEVTPRKKSPMKKQSTTPMDTKKSETRTLAPPTTA